MPYEIQWMIPDRVIYMRDYGVCTSDELQGALGRADQLFNEGQAPVHMIHDNREMESFVPSLNTIRAMMKVNPNSGLLIYISNPNKPISHFITTILTTISRKPFTYVNSLAEAKDYLRGQDETLAPLFSEA